MLYLSPTHFTNINFACTPILPLTNKEVAQPQSQEPLADAPPRVRGQTLPQGGSCQNPQRQKTFSPDARGTEAKLWKTARERKKQHVTSVRASDVTLLQGHFGFANSHGVGAHLLRWYQLPLLLSCSAQGCASTSSAISCCHATPGPGQETALKPPAAAAPP